MAEAGARPPKIMWCEFRGQIALDGEACSQVEPPESLYPACFLAFRRSGAARGSGLESAVNQFPDRTPNLLGSLYSANTGRKLWAQQAGISRLVGQPAHGCESHIGGVRTDDRKI